MTFFEQSIVTNGIDFIAVKMENNDGGFEHTFNKSMCKELFRKLNKND